MFGRQRSAEKLASALEEYRRDYEERLRTHPNLEAQRAAEVIQKGKELVNKSGIGNALVKLLEDVKYWPSWSQRDDFNSYVKFPATDILATEEEKTQQNRRTVITKVYFVYKSKRYGLIMKDEGYSTLPDGESRKYGRLDFVSDDTVVLSLNVAKTIGEYDSYWRWFDLEALTIGPWTKELVEIAAHIKIKSAEMMRERANKTAKDKAKNIRL